MNDTPESSARRAARPAPLGWRLLALTYDSLPMIPLLMVTSAVFLWLHGGRTVETDPVFQWLETLAMWALVGSYFVFSWRRGGQTMGMRPWRLQVLAQDGRPAGLAALWLRYLVACLTPGLCLAWCLVDRERRGLHDLAAGTIFVRLEAAAKA
ncbi:RDD family protein [Arenimonas oryziterrae]|uniref:RDD domain-containing protein n=1 Tax=Arenimonas oryziterrae DSM 21050 = YC6267 TaxID=1121015 RepID=A0A091AVA8_9GAMM|nr:RDD family protein [Arenimonas oryziterrae]KFN43197.1 hypothetical protein N789_11585 [Arenimonas oryziterrae DSM 21050 = YC6267]